MKNVAGAFKASLPRVPGRDYAGLGVTRDGTHAEYVVVHSDWLSEKPAHLTMPQAAAVGVPYLAAWMAVHDAGSLEVGRTVLITGALGAVGRAAPEIARWSGAEVIGADRFDGPPGAEAWIDTRTMELALEARRLSGGRGVVLVVDAVGGPLFEASLRSLRSGGRHVVLTSVGNRRVEFDLLDFYHNASHLIGIDAMQLSGTAVASILDRLRKGFDMGRLTPPTVTAVWPLARGIEAYSAVEAGAPGAKHVLAPPREQR